MANLARRNDRVVAEVGHADPRGWSGAVGGEGGDRLFLAQSLGGEVVRDLAGQQAEGGVDFVSLDLGDHPRSMSTSDPDAGLRIGLLEAAESHDARLVDRLTHLVNGVYRTAESGLWRDDATRTTASELAELIAARQIAVAARDGQIAGSVRIRDVADDASEFGMLVAAPDHRGTGVGRALLAFVERHSRERGQRRIQLELLVPRAWRHPSKEFLKSWYGRSGYRLIRTGSIDDAYPHLAPLLSTPCDLTIYEKPLGAR